MRCAGCLALAVVLTLLMAGSLFAQTVRVTADRANLRDKPASDGAIVVTVAKGDELEVLGEVGRWYLVSVRVTGAQGYISSLLAEVVGEPLTRSDPAQRSSSAQAAAGLMPPAAVTRSTAGRGWLDVNIGIAQSAQSQEWTTPPKSPRTTVYDAITAYDKASQGTHFDLGGGLLLNPIVGIGLDISKTSHEASSYTALVGIDSSPAGYRRYKSEINSARRSEGSLNLHVVISPVRSKSVLVRIFGGPSGFRVTQEMAVKPFSKGFQEETGTGVGLHIGADLGVFLSRVLGVGATARWSRGHVDVMDPYSKANVTLKAGGLQFAGGLRLRL